MKELTQIKLLKQLEEGYVTFDNSSSDIVADNVGEAIKEVNEKVKSIDVTVEANEVTYTDNKTLGATNVQEAIDKLKEYADTQDDSKLLEAKTYVDNKISAIDLIDIQVLAVLPPSGEADVLYMIGDVNTTDIFELYIWENNKFIKVGSTTIDLSQYALKSEIPVNLSQLNNDTNFITQGDIPTNLSELTNDTNFVTVNDIINDTSSATNKTYSSDKINQLLQTVQPVSNAQNVTYTDNKGLSATNVQEAIDKTVDKIPAHAGQIGFTSAQGIVANNVGGALDELKQDLANAGGASTAQDVSYDDSTTQLGATNVQDVIKILDTNIKNINAGITLANNEW